MRPLEQMNVGELKELLRIRGQTVAGLKEELIARIKRYDADHPFKFLRLSLECRRDIYVLSSLVDEVGTYALSTKPTTNERRNALAVQQPSIFRVNKQARSEGLPVFFATRRFDFVLRSISSAGGLSQWLGTISNPGFSNAHHLRHLTITLTKDNCRGLYELREFMDEMKTTCGDALAIEFVTWDARQKDSLVRLTEDSSMTFSRYQTKLEKRRFDGSWEEVEDFFPPLSEATSGSMVKLAFRIPKELQNIA